MEVICGSSQADVGTSPTVWQAAPLGDYVRITSGESPSRFSFVASGYPYFEVEQLGNSEKYLDLHSTPYQFQKGRTVPSGSVIFAKRGGAIALNRIRILVQESFMDTNLMALTVVRSLDTEYLYYALVYIGLWRFADTTSVPQINNKHIKPLLFPLPKIEEQRAISTVLRDFDALLEELGRLIAKKRDLKQATMQQLLTGKTRLPGFQGEWTVERLDGLGTWKGGMTPSMQNDSFWVGGNIPWISSGDVKTVLLEQSGFYITQAAVKQGTTTMLPANCILIVTRSGILRRYLPVAMNAIPMAINQDIKALIPSGRFFAPFLLHAIIGHGDQILATCMKTGTTVESIELRWLKAFMIPVPPLDEQVSISGALSDMDAEITALEQRLGKTRDLKQGMMQELLTGKTRLITPEALDARTPSL